MDARPAVPCQGLGEQEAGVKETQEVRGLEAKRV